jgi:DNA primase large subunit
MAKQKKKRNKVYKGVEASVTRPTITRLSAVKRNKVQQWWFDKKKFTKPVLIAAGVAVVIIWLIYELIRLVAGAA